MAGTLIEQRQLDPTATADFNDGLTMSGAESTALNTQDDLNFIRSQLLILMGADQNDWFDAPTKTLTTLAAQATLEDKMILRRIYLGTDVVVPASQNYKVLVQASSETPTRPIAIATTVEGAISAQLAGTVGSHSLTAISGTSTIRPSNIVVVRDGISGGVILSSGKEVYALLQVENTAVDAGAFNDTGNQAQLSFVRVNYSTNALEAVPVADIEGKTINYFYADRINLADAMDYDFDPADINVDQVASVDVTLQNAVSNQTGSVTQGSKNIDVRLTDTYEWQFSETGGAGILTVAASAGGDSVEVGDGANAASFRGHGTGQFDGNLVVDFDDQAINLGVTTGRIDSTSLELKSTTGILSLDAATELHFADSRQTTAFPLTDATYNTLSGLPGGPYTSMAHLWSASLSASTVTRADANTTTVIGANTLITSATNLSASLLDYQGKTFTSDVIIFINGVYQRPGANNAANHDVYPSAVPSEQAVGAFYSEAKVKNNANVMMLLIG